MNLEPALDGMIPMPELKRLAGGGFLQHAREAVKERERLIVRVTRIDAAKKEIGLAVVRRDGMAPEEDERRSVGVAENAGPVEWLDSDWPWTAGENAIVAKERPQTASGPAATGTWRRAAVDLVNDYWLAWG